MMDKVEVCTSAGQTVIVDADAGQLFRRWADCLRSRSILMIRDDTGTITFNPEQVVYMKHGGGIAQDDGDPDPTYLVLAGGIDFRLTVADQEQLLAAFATALRSHRPLEIRGRQDQLGMSQLSINPTHVIYLSTKEP